MGVILGDFEGLITDGLPGGIPPSPDSGGGGGEFTFLRPGGTFTYLRPGGGQYRRP